MVADTLFTFLIWLVQHSVLAVLPLEFSALPLATLQTELDNAQTFLSGSFAGLNNIFPIYLFVAFLIVVILAEIILFGIKATKFIANLVRGSGA